MNSRKRERMYPGVQRGLGLGWPWAVECYLGP